MNVVPQELGDLIATMDRMAKRLRARFVIDPDKVRDFGIAIERRKARNHRNSGTNDAE